LKAKKSKMSKLEKVSQQNRLLFAYNLINTRLMCFNVLLIWCQCFYLIFLFHCSCMFSSVSRNGQKWRKHRILWQGYCSLG
jgi:hypothetical protein